MMRLRRVAVWTVMAVLVVMLVATLVLDAS